MKAQEKDRILRMWTPVILRTVLAAAGIVLIANLIAIRLTRANISCIPGRAAQRWRQGLPDIRAR
jgi:hypothetical protein